MVYRVSLDESGVAFHGVTASEFRSYAPLRCISVSTYMQYECTILMDGQSFVELQLWVHTWPPPHLLAKRLAGLKDIHPNSSHQEVCTHWAILTRILSTTNYASKSYR